VTVEPWTTKVKKARVIDLNAETLAVLKAWRRQTAFEFVFTNELGERMLGVRHWEENCTCGTMIVTATKSVSVGSRFGKNWIIP
jgi:hypothetical protein